MLKEDLLKMLANKNRGIGANVAEKQAIEREVAAVEATNPNPQPLQRPDLLEGDWRLVYTSSTSLLNLDRLPLSQLQDIYQCVRMARSSIYNIAEIRSLPYLSSVVSVVASFQPIDERRVQVDFRRSVAGLQSMLNYNSVADWIDRLDSGEKMWAADWSIDNPKANSWLDITYLDESLRIGRGNQGSVFVLTKV
jgi:PAP_fibrillin